MQSFQKMCFKSYRKFSVFPQDFYKTHTEQHNPKEKSICFKLVVSQFLDSDTHGS